MHTRRRHAARAFLLGVLLVSGAGCSPGTASPTPTSSPDSAPASPETPTASPTPTSEANRAAAGAQDTVVAFYRVLDSVKQDEDKNLDPLIDVAIRDELATWRTQMGAWAADEWVQSGNTTVVESVVQDVALPAGADDAPTVQVDVCVDVTETDVVDASGTSVVSPDRPDRAWYRHTVTNFYYEKDPDGGWRVADTEQLEQEPCTAR